MSFPQNQFQSQGPPHFQMPPPGYQMPSTGMNQMPSQGYQIPPPGPNQAQAPPPHAPIPPGQLSLNAPRLKDKPIKPLWHFFLAAGVAALIVVLACLDIESHVYRTVKKISFNYLSPDQVRRQSVKAIVNAQTFDALGHPILGGLYDPALGPVQRGGRCSTCGLGEAQCPGHFGHIELCLPVYNPLNFAQMFQLLRLTCLYCHRLRMPPVRAALFWGRMKLLQAGMVMEAKDLEQWLNHTITSVGVNTEDESAVLAVLDQEQQLKLIQGQVKKLIQNNPNAANFARQPRNGLTAEYRRQLINEFLKKIPATNLCQHCKGYVPALHRHGGTKIFLNPLRKSMAQVMAMKRMSPDALFETKLGEAEAIGAESRFRSAKVEGNGSGGPDEDFNQEDALIDDNTEMTDAEDEDLDDADVDDIRLAKKSINMDEARAYEPAETLTGATDQPASNTLRYLTPLHVFEHLKALFDREGEILHLIFSSTASVAVSAAAAAALTDHRIFFTQILAIPPNRFRPPSVFGDSSFDHPQNGYLADILRVNLRLIELAGSDLEQKKTEQPKREQKNLSSTKVIETWIQLQEQVNYFFDSSRNTNVGMGKIPPPGIKQILEKKEGLFRKHMMGKRVNFAARSVISPDPNLDVGEIGVPMVFAKKLTYPEPVTAYNVDRLQTAIINGPEKYPGASHVQLEDGTLQALEALKPAARRALAASLSNINAAGSLGSGPGSPSMAAAGIRKVLRNLQDGDLVLMNRQPTLHKPSMMAHRVRVLEGEKTLRMHYANCDAYNADFDGDEMNLHFPQNELARAELAIIAATDAQYLVPTDGSPIRGLIQDHVVTGVILTLKDTFLDAETFQQLLFAALPESMASSPLPIIFGPPAILRPRALWTGKQLISAALANVTRGLPALNLRSKCKVSPKLWTSSHAEESQVHLQEGYFLHGVLDKSQIGASSQGITHACYELYGGAIAGRFLSVMGRLLTRWDQLFGFTCRMDDLLLTKSADGLRSQIFRENVGKDSEATILNYVKVAGVPNDSSTADAQLERIARDEELTRGLDGAMKMAMNSLTSKVIDATLPQGQMLRFPRNNMSLMTLTGAKGSMVNFSQISGCLGQQELEGRRVPAMVSGRTLPCFRPYAREARAGGYIAQRFLTGIRPAEFYFHCMAGREGLIDTAVKTSRSGYLQRCLIKHLETLRIHYDHTVRSDDLSIVQFAYGEDGLDVLKQGLLQSSDHQQLEFCAANFESLLRQCQPHRALSALPLSKPVRKAASRALRKPAKYPPVMSQHLPTSLGVTSEKFYSALEAFLAANASKFQDAAAGKDAAALYPATQDQFRVLMWLKYLRSLAEPGEAVGLLAAQSLGEPSTQMTLNTFHFAGFGAKNVTLGIPRLREIIMTASPNLKTPTMSLTLTGAWAHDSALATQLSHRLSRLTLKNVLQEVTVTERLVSRLGSCRNRIYSVVLEFIPGPEMLSHYSANVGELESTLRNVFIARLMSAIDRILRAKGKKSEGAVAAANTEKLDLDDLITVSKMASVRGVAPASEDGGTAGGAEGARPAEHDESDSDEDAEARDLAEDDIDGAKMLSKRNQNASYEDDERDVSESEAVTAAGSETEEADGPPKTTEPAPVATALKAPCVLDNYPHVIKNFHFTLDGPAPTLTFDMAYSAATHKFLLLDIIERISDDVVIRHIPGIQKAHLIPPESPNSPFTISTEGINFRGVLDTIPFEALEHAATTCNSIHAILGTYGVEAARAALVHEISAVFAVYGISIDARHLSLIADYMTQEGGYRAFNRSGIDASPSPLLKATYETTLTFLKNATFSAESDDLVSPASRIVLGLPVALGTGAFEIRQPIA